MITIDMYGALAYPKLLCRAAYGGFIFYDVLAEFHGALLNNTFHCSTLQTIPIANRYAWKGNFSTRRAKRAYREFSVSSFVSGL